MTMPKSGQWAELCQPGGHWLPFLITHVHDADTVSGVAFSGQPSRAGWHRPVADFAHVTRGESNRQWREIEAEAAPAEAPAEEAPEADDLTVISRLGEATANWLATHDIDSFAALAAIDDEDIEVLADDADAPSGVTEDRLREWREDAAKRAA